MLSYFNQLSDAEKELFANEIICKELTFTACEVYYTIDKMYSKLFKGRKAIVVELKPKLPNPLEDDKYNLFPPYCESDVEENKFAIIISNRGIFNKKRTLFVFKRKRRIDLEQLLIEFIAKNERKKTLENKKNLRQFSFSRF